MARRSSNAMRQSRSPHGERGLKLAMCETNPDGGGSLSSWRAWIEMGTTPPCVANLKCRSPHGERGLKLVFVPMSHACHGRSPHGERGLKLHVVAGQLRWRAGRSPHGERGLKYPPAGNRHPSSHVALLMESVD